MRWTVATFALVLIGAGSCAQRSSTRQASSGKPEQPVKSIELPRYQVELPAGTGREMFAVSCLSCHSARYIGMQPPLSQAKWDEEVRKMIKNYGAPIAEEQVPVIVSYLMTTKEGANPRSWNTLESAAQEYGIVETIRPATIEDLHDRDAARGALLYAQSCASCHGTSGAGNGPSAGALLPSPTDLKSHSYSALALTRALVNGVPGTAMPSFRTMSNNDLRALVTYTSQLSSAASAATAPAGTEALYTQNCASCHGAKGFGDGIAAAALARRPTNFQNVQPTASAAEQAIANGIPGTAMTQWAPKLSVEQRHELAEYVRSLYAPN